jgi:gluconate 2-dehydrogenase gamma chain
VKDSDTPKISRRTVIASATLIPIAAIKAAPQSAASPIAATVFSPEQRRVLDAFVSRLIPNDETGPGAVECGVPEYIDRCLADYLAAEKAAFFEGLASLDAFARSSQGVAFAELSAEKQDAVLMAIESNQTPGLLGFFNRARRLTLEGMFGDPIYGGNKNFAGWDLIRYPGAKLAAAPEDQTMKTPPKPYRRSVYGGGEHGH